VSNEIICLEFLGTVQKEILGQYSSRDESRCVDQRLVMCTDYERRVSTKPSRIVMGLLTMSLVDHLPNE
jgi:uncharacterized protein YciW